MTHRLDPLLKPRSVAVVGASSTKDSMGAWALENLERGGFAGNIYPVNPRYSELRGSACYGTLGELPETPDLVIFAVADKRVEQTLDDAIAAGIPAAVIMSSLHLDNDSLPGLKERVQRKIDAAEMLVCGANGMGFYNVRDNVWGCGFDTTLHTAPGNISLISHSGSGMSGIIDCDARLQINFACSTGNELSVTMDEYLDFVLDLPETRVVGLFIETARNPAGFRAALEKANRKRIPVVAIKTGKTEMSAQLAVSHSGAMAGEDSTYDALFDRYGVQRVRDMDELATALILFAQLHPLGPGGLVSLHDSGGERQLMVDLCDEAGIELIQLSSRSESALRDVLDPELPPVNPLDGWSRGGPDAAQKMTDALSILMNDEGAALGALVHDRAPEGLIYSSYIEYMHAAKKRSSKPVALVGARQGTGHDARTVSETHSGFPVLDGLSPFLRGVKALFDYRDFLEADNPEIESPDMSLGKKWRDRLKADGTLNESGSLNLLREFGMPASTFEMASSLETVLAAATKTGYPLVVKTAEQGVHHKSDVDGVILDIGDEESLLSAYDAIATNIGPLVITAPMAGPGVEMILGARRDTQFGPIVILGFGGVLAEVLNDVQFALPPFSPQHARRCVDRLRLRAVLDGARGNPAADIDAYCELAATFSTMVDVLREEVSEIDVNPVIVHPQGCTIVDSLIIGRECV